MAMRKHPAAWIILLRDNEGPLDLIEGLNAATKHTTKGKYHKTKHAPALLESIRPALVRKAAPNCERFFRIVLEKLA
jgi:hypothetical protein